MWVECVGVSTSSGGLSQPVGLVCDWAEQVGLSWMGQTGLDLTALGCRAVTRGCPTLCTSGAPVKCCSFFLHALRYECSFHGGVIAAGTCTCQSTHQPSGHLLSTRLAVQAMSESYLSFVALYLAVLEYKYINSTTTR